MPPCLHGLSHVPLLLDRSLAMPPSPPWGAGLVPGHTRFRLLRVRSCPLPSHCGWVMPLPSVGLVWGWATPPSPPLGQDHTPFLLCGIGSGHDHMPPLPFHGALQAPFPCRDSLEPPSPSLSFMQPDDACHTCLGPSWGA